MASGRAGASSLLIFATLMTAAGVHLVPAPLNGAEVAVPRVQVGNQLGTGRGQKRAFLELDRLVFRFEEGELGDTFYWAAIVLDRDGNNEPADDFEVGREDVNTGWVDARSTAPGGSSQVPRSELLRVADVDDDASERPVMFPRDAAGFSDGGLPGPYIVLHNPDCPDAETARPTKDDHCDNAENGPDDLVALVGAGRLVPQDLLVTLDHVAILFPDDNIPVVRSGTVEYYAIVVLINADAPDSAPRIFSSGGVTFSDLH